MTRRVPKGMRIFEAVATLGCAIEAVKGWLLYPACPWCGQRTSDLETHFHREHAGDEYDMGWLDEDTA